MYGVSSASRLLKTAVSLISESCIVIIGSHAHAKQQRSRTNLTSRIRSLAKSYNAENVHLNDETLRKNTKIYENERSYNRFSRFALNTNSYIVAMVFSRQRLYEKCCTQEPESVNGKLSNEKQILQQSR